MKHTEVEIIKSLNVIKDICCENECDNSCPFYDSYSKCMVLDREPYKWNVFESEPVFKAFKGVRQY